MMSDDEISELADEILRTAMPSKRTPHWVHMQQATPHPDSPHLHVDPPSGLNPKPVTPAYRQGPTVEQGPYRRVEKPWWNTKDEPEKEAY